MHMLTSVYVKYCRDPIKVLIGVDYTKNALSTIIYQVQSKENGYVRNPVSLTKNVFSASNFSMHMFTRSLVCMENTEEIQLKL